MILLGLDGVWELRSYYSSISLQPKVAHYYVFGKCVSGPARPNALWNAPGNAVRMVDVGCELETETRGIDVTQRAESIGEGISV